MMTMKTTLGIGHAGTLLEVTVKTLYRWKCEGGRSGNAQRRRYTKSQLRGFLRLRK